MENCPIKANIFTNDIIYKETVEQSIDADFSLPDYCSNVERIHKCKALPRISSKSINGKNITIDGMITVTIIYSDDSGHIKSYEYAYPFEKTKETDVDFENAKIYLSAKCDYINCRAVTSRKIDIHGAISISVVAKSKTKTEIVVDVDDKDIELLRGGVPASSPTGSNEKYILIEEESELPADCFGEAIIRHDECTTIKEYKTVSGKVIAKGELQVNIRYLSDNKIECMKTVIPFSQILEVETVGDNCECEVKSQISSFEIKPKNDSDGKFRYLTINSKILITAESFCPNDVDVILDAYWRKGEAEILKKNVCFNKVVKKASETYNCKKSISVDDGNIASVLDNWCDIKINDTKVSDDSLCVKGTVTASLIIEDSEGSSSYIEKPVEFEYKYPIGMKGDNLSCEPEISILSCGYTITSENSIEIRAELFVSLSIIKCSNVAVVTEIETPESTQKIKSNDNAMTIYFASNGERLWDVARKYLASSEEIKEINGIDVDVFGENTMLLIPIK